MVRIINNLGNQKPSILLYGQHFWIIQINGTDALLLYYSIDDHDGPSAMSTQVIKIKEKFQARL